jgi:hypothetical protein
MINAIALSNAAGEAHQQLAAAQGGEGFDGFGGQFHALPPLSRERRSRASRSRRLSDSMPEAEILSSRRSDMEKMELTGLHYYSHYNPGGRTCSHKTIVESFAVAGGGDRANCRLAIIAGLGHALDLRMRNRKWLGVFALKIFTRLASVVIYTFPASRGLQDRRQKAQIVK